MTPKVGVADIHWVVSYITAFVNEEKLRLSIAMNLKFNNFKVKFEFYVNHSTCDVMLTPFQRLMTVMSEMVCMYTCTMHSCLLSLMVWFHCTCAVHSCVVIAKKEACGE